MKTPPEIVFKGLETTPQIDGLITKGIAKLEKVSNNIITARIAVESAQGRHQTENPFRIRIYVTLPERREIVVDRYSVASKKSRDGFAEKEAIQAVGGEPEPEMDQPVGRNPLRRRLLREEPLEAMIRRAFDSARRELEKVMDKQRGEVKAKPGQQAQAIVEKIYRDQGYGFLRTLAGEQVYFHRNSVLHNHWESLKVGTAVRCTPETGEKGLQASTVEPVEKPGTAEAHDDLHDLPVLVSRPAKKKRVKTV